MFAVRSKTSLDEWLISQHHWGPAVERAEFKTRQEAERHMRMEFTYPERVAEIVEV
jgi:hypothetical protein